MLVIIKVSINVLKEHSINKISIVFLRQHKVVCTGAQEVLVRGGGREEVMQHVMTVSPHCLEQVLVGSLAHFPSARSGERKVAKTLSLSHQRLDPVPIAIVIIIFHKQINVVRCSSMRRLAGSQAPYIN